jgi:hypothetical protein
VDSFDAMGHVMLSVRQAVQSFRAKRELPLSERFWRGEISLRLVVAFLAGAFPVFAAQAPSKVTWKSVEFAIVKFNDEAPKSWSMYHTEKKGLLLVRIWKRYLLVNVKEQEAYEIDPHTVKPAGDNVEWSLADKPSEPLETPEWKTRDVGPMEQVSFRLGKNGYVLALQIPLKMNGQPMY